MRRKRWTRVALLLACGAWWSCGGKRGLLVADGGWNDLGAELGPTADSPSPGPDAGPDVVDAPWDQPGVTADSLLPDRTGRQPDAAAQDSADLRPAAPDQGLPGETSGPVTAAPSGGCVPGIISPSFAFRGVVGIDFDEDGIADEVDRCPSVATSWQGDSDGDGLGDTCDRCSGGADGDQDGVCDDADNCPVDWNPGQYDIDGNGLGDRCDSPRCFSAPANEDLQRILQRLLRKPEFTAPLVDAHWRLISTRAYCRNNAVAVSLQILDYTHRKLLTVGHVVEADELVSLVESDVTDLQGPQPSVEEGWEAAYMAERSPEVAPILDSLRYRISAGAFFYEFGTRPDNNDPAFPTCATGRCVDVLYSGYPPDGGYGDYSVVVEMDACQVLGIKRRPWSFVWTQGAAAAVATGRCFRR